ncbi:MAG: tRNA-5-methyluridine54 2-sulfurtransferase [Candidatus Woesearchaeota archaeon]|nr:tRNA-5-methyluridine54 2-sulfurtransferase [Candidatus Woesearchaeota archaeon]MDN5327856.1 tRNA-5-methyluridine54 2-sulfurtransferase [Candidatus Woesearchaeota archaeon]
MKCKFCRNKAVYAEERLCKEHFNKYFEKRIRKYFDSLRLKNLKLLIAVSGGKDSSAIAYSLNQIKDDYNLTLELLYLDLGIKDYSQSCKKTAMLLSETLGLKLNIIDVPKEYHKSIDDFDENYSCSACGTFKRYLINKFAFENNFDYVVTGHNLDDELFFVMNNLLNRNTEYLLRSGKLTETKKQLKLVGRLKPLYYLTEKESLIFCIVNKIPFTNIECPHGNNSTQLRMKKKLNEFFDSRAKKINFIKSINSIKKEYLEQNKELMNFCEECGYPTNDKVCRFCRLIK